MYKRMTKEQAINIADSLVPANHFGYSTKVIDQHWEVDLFINNSLAEFLNIPSGKALLRLYECIEDVGFVVSKSMIVDYNRDAVAEAIQTHVNDCIDEWTEEGISIATNFAE